MASHTVQIPDRGRGIGKAPLQYSFSRHIYEYQQTSPLIPATCELLTKTISYSNLSFLFGRQHDEVLQETYIVIILNFDGYHQRSRSSEADSAKRSNGGQQCGRETHVGVVFGGDSGNRLRVVVISTSTFTLDLGGLSCHTYISPIRA